MRALCTIAFCFIALIFPLTSAANLSNKAEEILGFHSLINVNADASIDVTEIISVYANQQKILHGIVRRLPIRYTDSYGIRHWTSYQLQQVLLNQERTDYHTSETGDQYAVYIGNVDTILRPDIYVYTISYRVPQAINFLKDADEFYWNITGNNWDFPILKAQVDVQLPPGAKVLHYAAYTGPLGAKGQDFTVTEPRDNQISFTTTRTLEPGEGLTIGVAFPKGIIIAPSWFERMSAQIGFMQTALLLVTLCLFGYFFFIWSFFGRDPRRGTIIPIFDPPENLSPAAMRYIYRMGFDMKCLPTLVVGLAAKGLVKITQDKSSYTLERTTNDRAHFTPEESVADETLFAGGPTLLLSTTANKAVYKSINALKNSLSDQFKNSYFKTNAKFLFLPVLVTIISYIAVIASVPEPGLLFWLIIWTFGCAYLCVKVWQRIRAAYLFPSAVNITSIFGNALFAVPFLAAEIVVWIISANSVPIITLPLMFLMGVLVVVFAQLLKQPTRAGRKLMDEIAGYKMYLSTTERYRLDAFSPPEQTPAVFEKNLPYAMALDVESQWGTNFQRYWTETKGEEVPYQPAWYSGPTFNAGHMAAFPAALSAGLYNAFGTSTTSSDSGGSGGGGSSGGGGGGGGGGGW